MQQDGTTTFFTCPIQGHTYARAVDRAGDIAGSCGTFLDQRGFFYRNGVIHFVVYPGAARTSVWDINSNGDIVGSASIEEAPNQIRTIAFLLRNGTVQDVSNRSSRPDYTMYIPPLISMVCP